jgi:hypothetical protein
MSSQRMQRSLRILNEDKVLPVYKTSTELSSSALVHCRCLYKVLHKKVGRRPVHKIVAQEL